MSDSTKRDEALERLRQLAARGAELAEAEPAPAAPASSKRRSRPARAPRRRWTPEDLLERFTPQQAYEFLFERTVPPGVEDGLALIEAYPELTSAAPELVADLAVAFRHKQRDAYAAHFALVAKHHGIDTAVQLELGDTERT